MANVSVFNLEGNEVGTLELNDAVFGVEVNEHLVHMAVVAQLANKRQGTQKAKTRSEVSGGGKKPWRQKGTGHARQSSLHLYRFLPDASCFSPFDVSPLFSFYLYGLHFSISEPALFHADGAALSFGHTNTRKTQFSTIVHSPS